MTDDAFDGVLPVDKPVGPTSHDVVAMARSALHMRRIGHTGTLDPFASGLLLLCVGRATRIAEYVTGFDKRYVATVRLGIVTDTDDHTGKMLAEKDATTVSFGAVERALAAQRGNIMQTPPLFSAKKQSGERAYDMARQGKEFTLAPVPVRISELNITRFAPPEVELDVVSSAGTYVRAIARDLGAALGVGAHLSALRRTAIGSVSVDGAVAVDELTDVARVRAALIAPLDAMGSMPRLDLSADDVAHIQHGRSVPLPAALRSATAIALVADNDLIAIGAVDGERIRPRKVFLS